jgi:hypothetical protein
VVGERSLIVRYSGVTIDLEHVIVTENATHQCYWGWTGLKKKIGGLKKGGAVSYVEDGKPVVNFLKDCKENAVAELKSEKRKGLVLLLQRKRLNKNLSILRKNYKSLP